MSGLRADILTEDDALAGILPEWWDLWRRSPGHLPFTSPAWLLPWWETFRPGPLRATTLREGGRLVAFAPFYLEEQSSRLLPLGIGISDMFDILVEPGTALEELAEAFGSERDWGIWELENLPPGGEALRLPLLPECDESLAPQASRPVLRLTPGWQLPTTKRRKLAMAKRRLAKRAGTIRAVDGRHEADAFLTELVRLHTIRWHERGEPGVLTDERVLEFHRRTIGQLAEAGLARLTVCEIEGVVAGAYYGFASTENAFAYLGGFDPAYAYESPGTLLIGHAIEEAAGSGAASFDFLRGQEAYKYEWGAQDVPNFHRRIIRR